MFYSAIARMKTFKLTLAAALLTLLAQSAFAVGAKNTIFVSFNAAGSTSTSASGASTFNFDSLTAGLNSSAVWSGVGSFSSLNVAANGGVGNSETLADGSGVSTTLNLTTPSSYFGLYIEKATPSETISFYNNSGTLLGTFTTADLLKDLPITYYTDPNTGSRTAQPFAYINFEAAPGSSWSSVVLTSKSGSFVADNLASGTTASLPGTALEYINTVSNTEVNQAPAADLSGLAVMTPEPSPAWAVGVLCCLTAGGSVVRRFRARK